MAESGLRRVLWTEEDMVKLRERISAITPPEGVVHPLIEHIEAALENCFWASLQTNEQRPIEGTLVFTGEKTCTQSIGFQDNADKPRMVCAGAVESVDLLVELLPLTDPLTSALALDGGKIWGVALTIPTDALMISILGPGQLLLRAGIQLIAYCSKGAFDIVFSRSLPSEHECISVTEEDVHILRFLQTLSRPLRALGHGGAVIVTPYELSGLDVPYRAEPKPRVRNWGMETQAERDLLSTPDDATLQLRAALERTGRDAMERRLRDSFAQLSAIDGAVVFRKGDLALLAFGAKIRDTNEVSEFELRKFPKYKAERCRPSYFKGTRHLSALRYVAAHKGAIVLVVSQDGRSSIIQALGEQGEDLRVYTGFEAALPLDAETLKYGHYISLSGRSEGKAEAKATLLIV